MTDLLQRPTARSRAGESRPPGAPVRRAVITAVTSALAGLIVIAPVVLIAWSTDARGGIPPADVLRAIGATWLFAHHVPVDLGFGAIGLVPIALAALPIALLIRAGVQVGRALGPGASWPDMGKALAVLAATYAVIATLIASVSTQPVSRIDAATAGAVVVVLTILAGGIGMAREQQLWSRYAERLPAHSGVSFRAGFAALMVLIAGGAVLSAIGLALHVGEAGDLSEAVASGAVGSVLLALLGILCAPNVAVLGAAYAVGPGFAIGDGTTVGITRVDLGPLPAVPWLAALPSGTSTLGWLVLIVPLTAGAIAGLLVARACADTGWRDQCGYAAAAGVVAGVGVALLAAAAGGPLGDGHLAAVGPSPWRIAVAVAAEVAVVAAVMAGAMRWWSQRNS